MENVAPTGAPLFEIELPLTKKKVTIKGWFTKEEAERTREPLMRHSIDVNNSGVTTQKVPASAVTEMEHLVVATAVTKIDEDTDITVEKLINLPESDYDFLKTSIDEKINPPKDQKA